MANDELQDKLMKKHMEKFDSEITNDILNSVNNIGDDLVKERKDQYTKYYDDNDPEYKGKYETYATEHLARELEKAMTPDSIVHDGKHRNKCTIRIPPEYPRLELKSYGQDIIHLAGSDPNLGLCSEEIDKPGVQSVMSELGIQNLHNGDKLCSLCLTRLIDLKEIIA